MVALSPMKIVVPANKRGLLALLLGELPYRLKHKQMYEQQREHSLCRLLCTYQYCDDRCGMAVLKLSQLI